MLHRTAFFASAFSGICSVVGRCIVRNSVACADPGSEVESVRPKAKADNLNHVRIFLFWSEEPTPEMVTRVNTYRVRKSKSLSTVE